MKDICNSCKYFNKKAHHYYKCNTIGCPVYKPAIQIIEDILDRNIMEFKEMDKDKKYITAMKNLPDFQKISDSHEDGCKNEAIVDALNLWLSKFVE